MGHIHVVFYLVGVVAFRTFGKGCDPAWEPDRSPSGGESGSRVVKQLQAPQQQHAETAKIIRI
jgi:hypothetical protein